MSESVADSVKQPSLGYRGVLEELADDVQFLQWGQQEGLYVALVVQPSLGVVAVPVTSSSCPWEPGAPSSEEFSHPPVSVSHVVKAMGACLPSPGYPMQCSQPMIAHATFIGKRSL